ncbi:unnamed protein product [Cryptosporidium hominis]|uniref:Uncharacterized protein n=1 Tax=Cryptosporidium hominis TaxID=237895 RepID=A0A0S4TF54_CRYHO|nr:hypothetical protein [Cryptosporidium hominis TU502]OLQ16653.1 hypothetical protein ChTU502y2012_385g0110 [Cryptosporidium hominis]PPA62964.1 hypothetical protein ChUKH1_11460 [Cryptosporidium hominis]PPS94111.1 Uncharacterized protein GY17_00002981 [Cryptosporidium hominis]CUV06088.1 unnamed protein product [Cryptosporidium hominis]|eukprot:PPS94111.1 Uncharacterized protein GY17_00002981 [Cryptosporidium hominis]
MDANILEMIDLEELIMIEGRLKNSILDLNKLVFELYNENCRILQHNLELNSLKNKSSNARERMGKLLKNAFFPKFNKLEEFDSLSLTYNSKNDVCLSKYDKNDKALFNHCEETKNFIGKKPDLNNHFKQSKVMKYGQNPPLFKEVQSSDNHTSQDSNQCDLNPESSSKNNEGQAVNVEYGDVTKHVINLLINENNYVKIQFSEFENDQIREDFAKEIIKSIGLKPIYFDCIKNLLKHIESKSEHVENLIDIANLDPWENDHKFLKN